MDQTEFVHPELKAGELFFSNSKKEWFSIIDFKSKRMGNQAYNGRGDKLSLENWFPIFIQEKELLDKSIKYEDLSQARKAFHNLCESIPGNK